MKTCSSLLRAIILMTPFLVTLFAAGPPVHAQVPGDENWANLFGQADLEGDIFAMASTTSDMYIGGSFRNAGDLQLGGVARWDGTSWSSLGEGTLAGVDGIIYAIAIDGNDVYVAGKFTKAGGVAANNVARWNMTTGAWSALGTGIGGDPSAYVGSITVVGGNVYVGGWFSTAGGVSANSIARWSKSGANWSSLGTGVDGDVVALGAQNEFLYVGGSFSTAGGAPAENIVRWNMTTQQWAPIIVNGVNGIEGYVNVITVGLGQVFIGGHFQKQATNEYIGNLKVGGDTASNIIRWTGAVWHALSAVFDQDVTTSPPGDGRQIYGGLGPDGVVRAITMIGDTVYVAGTFTSSRPETMTSNAASTSFIGRWEGFARTKPEWSNIAWSNMRGGTNGYVNALASIGLNLYAGGSFRKAGGQTHAHVARWNIPSNAWSGLSSGPSGSISAVGLRGTDVYVAGLMAAPDGKIGYRIAQWAGNKWVTFNTTVSGPIYTMAIGGDNIYVGGMFTQAAGINATNVARYSLTTKTWSTLGGTGVGGVGVTYVAALAYKGTSLYAGGDFKIADDVAASGVARWDGTKWSPLGSGVNGWVNALAVADNGDVYVGGDFSSAGGVPAKNIARWDGTKWNALGSGVDDAVRAITISGTNVYVGGDFNLAGSIASRAIALWDGTQWKGMGGGIDAGLYPLVNSISVSGSSVYVTGAFDKAGTISVNNIARWDGTTWHTLGSGTDAQIRASVISGSSLYVGGDFDMAGGKPSYKFGEWTAVPNIIVPDDDHDDAPSITLLGGSPNPVSSVTTIRFSINSAGSSASAGAAVAGISSFPERLRVTIHDALGRTVATLLDEAGTTGTHMVEWNASDVADGVYFCRLQRGGRVETGEIIVRR